MVDAMALSRITQCLNQYRTCSAYKDHGFVTDNENLSRSEFSTSFVRAGESKFECVQQAPYDEGWKPEFEYKLNIDARNSCVFAQRHFGFDGQVDDEQVENTTVASGLSYAVGVSKSASGLIPALLWNVSMAGASYFGTKYQVISDSTEHGVRIVSDRSEYQVFINPNNNLFDMIIHRQFIKANDLLRFAEKLRQLEQQQPLAVSSRELEELARTAEFDGLHVDTVRYLDAEIRF